MIFKFSVVTLVAFFSIVSTGCASEPCGAHSRLAYAHLAEFSPSLGGMPSTVEINYLAADGTFQASHETTDDQILKLGIGRVSVDADFFIQLKKLAAAPLSSNTLSPGVENDGSPARTQLLVCTREGKASYWVGDTSKVPRSVAQAISLIKQNIDRASPRSADGSMNFLRTRQMNRKLSELTAGTYVTPDSRTLQPGTPLAIGIAYPYRLIPFPKGDNPLFLNRRQPERPVTVVIDNIAYRVHLLKPAKH